MNAEDIVRETAEKHHAGEQPKWIPIAAAVLAVLAAVSGFLASLRSTGALFAKNDAAIATTHAADSWNEYESRSIKQHISASVAETVSGASAAKLEAVASHERTAGIPAQAKARQFERDAQEANDRSDRLIHAHEILEVATTLFEIAIVLISITALLGSYLLRVAALVAAGAGLAVLVYGALV